MVLAKVALGFCGALVLAGAYSFHDGVVRVDVDENHSKGTHLHVWAPALIVPTAMYFVPRQHVRDAAKGMEPWLPTIRVLTKELEKYPEAQLVEVRDSNDHVRVGVHRGKLFVDVESSDEKVHVSCPLIVIREVGNALEADAPGI
jgi:hypothetical protein